MKPRFTFDDIIAEPYEHRGIPHSEMVLILQTLALAGIEVVIESGRARAQSTTMIAKYLPDVDVHSVEMRPHEPDAQFGAARCKSYPNITLYEGSASELVPMLVESVAPARTAILLDGPKGAAAVHLLAQCFRTNPHVMLGFIHDMRRLDHGGPSPHRAVAVEVFGPNVFFSDDPRLVPVYSKFDARVVEVGGPCGEAFEEEFGSYGPTVGVFRNPQATSTKQKQAGAPP